MSIGEIRAFRAKVVKDLVDQIVSDKNPADRFKSIRSSLRELEQEERNTLPPSIRSHLGELHDQLIREVLADATRELILQGKEDSAVLLLRSRTENQEARA